LIERELQIINRLGLHARAAAKLVGVASGFGCEVFLTCNNREINAKSIMGVMMLAAGRGSILMVRTDGEQESEAMDAIVALVNDRFGEDD
jgi:phosphocarrier protein